MEQKSEHIFNPMLPLDVLGYIFTLLDNEKDFLRASLVNKTWYFLLNSKDEAFKRFIEKYINEHLTQHVPNHSLNFGDKTRAQLLAVAEKLNSRTRHINLARTEVVLRNQISFNTIRYSFKHTARSLRDQIIPSYVHNPTMSHVFKYFLGLLLLGATVLYALRVFVFEQDDTFLNTLLETPLLLTRGLYNHYKNPALFTFAVMFLVKLYQNIRQADNLFQQNLVHDIQNIQPQQKTKTTISNPINYMTISWKRENIFSPKASSKDDSKKLSEESISDLSTKKYV